MVTLKIENLKNFIHRNLACFIVSLFICATWMWALFHFVYNERLTTRDERIQSLSNEKQGLISEKLRLQKDNDSLRSQIAILQNRLNEISSRTILRPTVLHVNKSIELLQGRLLAALFIEPAYGSNTTDQVLKLSFRAITKGSSWDREIATVSPYVGSQQVFKYEGKNYYVNILEAGNIDG